MSTTLPPESVITLTSGATVTIDGSLGSTFLLAAVHNAVLAFSNVRPGQKILVYITQGAGGPWTPDISALTLSDDGTPTWSTSAGVTDALLIQKVGSAYRLLAFDTGFAA